MSGKIDKDNFWFIFDRHPLPWHVVVMPSGGYIYFDKNDKLVDGMSNSFAVYCLIIWLLCYRGTGAMFRSQIAKCRLVQLWLSICQKLRTLLLLSPSHLRAL